MELDVSLFVRDSVEGDANDQGSMHVVTKTLCALLVLFEYNDSVRVQYCLSNILSEL